jgi:hypothetical protein
MPGGGHEYPDQDVDVVPFPADMSTLFPRPPGLVEDSWPPTQLGYLRSYLNRLGCSTIVVESHYVDRDYIHDMALFYSLNLRCYPNHCSRFHFFRTSFDKSQWREFVIARGTKREEVRSSLQRAYLGFSVRRPLPGAPIGRTVVPTLDREGDTHKREFTATREYSVHLGGFELSVVGLAFQQQDQGVSACATTALWSSFHRTAHDEGLTIPTPAAITEAASRYFLAGGRALPSEGLTVDQICEAIRAGGLAPMVIRSVSPESDRAQLLGYLQSGFAPILAIRPFERDSGHAVCGVGVKLGSVQPQTDPKLHYRDAATAVLGVYINDDRLGPYASADIYPHTKDGKIRTALRIRWPGGEFDEEHSHLTALIVPVPTKVRLSVTRMRSLGIAVAETAGRLAEFGSDVTIGCHYERGTMYKSTASRFGLSDEGLYELMCRLVLSRYVGLIEVSGVGGPLFDVLLDATETTANPAALACIRREVLPEQAKPLLREIARKLGAPFVS